MTPEPDRAASDLHDLGLLTRRTVHDLNNSMMTILVFAELALESLGEGDPLHAQIVGILGAGRRAISTARELHGVARELAPHGAT